MWHADILTYLPELYPGLLQHSLLGKALSQNIYGPFRHMISQIFRTINIVILMINQLVVGQGWCFSQMSWRAIDNCHENDIRARRVVYLSPAGKRFDQKMAHEWAESDGIIFLCGRFEGVDQRALEARNVEEVSLGDFILCGGDVAAMAMIEATVRLLDGTVGTKESLIHESFENSLLEHPQYTRPRMWEGYNIPDILLSGNHQAIAEWRHEQAILRTKERRPDLWNEYCCKNKKD